MFNETSINASRFYEISGPNSIVDNIDDDSRPAEANMSSTHEEDTQPRHPSILLNDSKLVTFGGDCNEVKYLTPSKKHLRRQLSTVEFLLPIFIDNFYNSLHLKLQVIYLFLISLVPKVSVHGSPQLGGLGPLF